MQQKIENLSKLLSKEDMAKALIEIAEALSMRVPDDPTWHCKFFTIHIVDRSKNNAKLAIKYEKINEILHLK